MEARVFGSQRDSSPQTTVVCDQTPFLANLSELSQFTEVKVGCDVQQQLVGKFIDGNALLRDAVFEDISS